MYSILAIGALTAVIGDLASHMGCSIGLKDSVTAIGKKFGNDTHAINGKI